MMSIETSGNVGRRSFLAALLHRFGNAVTRWNETQHLDPREVEAIAHELNLSRAELNALGFTPSDAVESLGVRLYHAGLSEAELAASHGDVLRDIRRVCSHCSYRRRCISDLKHGRCATPEKYCPNEQTLQALADQAHQGSSRIVRFPANGT